MGILSMTTVSKLSSEGHNNVVIIVAIMSPQIGTIVST